MDVCINRPLIATACRYDSTIRIWNYIENKCILARKFLIESEILEENGPLLTLAFHPFGYYLAAGFSDKIRFFHIMHNDLKIYKELMFRNCIYMKFSNGG
jgi:WD40 repeat protein